MADYKEAYKMDISDKDFYDKARNEIQINVLAPLHLVSLFAGLQSLDTVINVTSGLAFVPLTKVPVYCATKAFFHSFTISLRHLLKVRNIEVIELIPPALNTDLGGKGLHSEHPSVADFIKAIFQQLEEGKNELTFGYSEMLSKATPVEIQGMFKRMNP
ncbi:short-subunit dehydrogenase involved in D-alanine esterification of teichoic acids [Chitinophaga sp. W2I13]|uniref:SDR family NAD(P)-dependent oxidoreductase n=1 Tax=Chitinophaga sp. W2I13 TaxID=3373923 RepID=UPI003D1EF553